MWVKSEYAEELAVLLAWLSLFVPWSITYGSANFGGLPKGVTVIFIRFPLGLIQYVFGLPLAEATKLKTPMEARADAFSIGNQGLGMAYSLWIAAAVVVLLAFVLSLLMYFETDVVETLPDRVRTMGGLLGLVALLLTVANYLVYENVPGLQIPLGVLLYYAFAVVLLRAERA